MRSNQPFAAKFVLLNGLFIGFFVIHSPGKEIQGNLSDDHHFQVLFQGSAANYYILRKGIDVTAINRPVALQSGVAAQNTISDPASATDSVTAFYRLEEVPLLT